MDIWFATSEQEREHRLRTRTMGQYLGPMTTQCPICRQRLVVAEVVVLTEADLAQQQPQQQQPQEYQDGSVEGDSPLSGIQTPPTFEPPNPSVHATVGGVDAKEAIRYPEQHGQHPNP